MLAADTPSPWVGVLWFGMFAAVGLLVAWRLRWQLANGCTPRHSTPGQQRVAMWGFASIGLVGLALVIRELFRALF